MCLCWISCLCSGCSSGWSSFLCYFWKSCLVISVCLFPWWISIFVTFGLHVGGVLSPIVWCGVLVVGGGYFEEDVFPYPCFCSCSVGSVSVYLFLLGRGICSACSYFYLCFRWSWRYFCYSGYFICSSVGVCGCSFCWSLWDNFSADARMARADGFWPWSGSLKAFVLLRVSSR